MVQLIQHFGDVDDDGTDCGICEACAPKTSLLRRFRPATDAEVNQARRILERIPQRGAVSTGVLFRETVEPETDRDTFELLLGALAHAGLVRTEAATFEKDGREIVFSKAIRTGRSWDGDDVSDLVIAERGKTPRTSKRKRNAPRSQERRAGTKTRGRSGLPIDASVKSSDAFETLRSWRSQRARELGIPAYAVLNDRTLQSLLEVRPKTPRQLLDVAGIGNAKAEKYGTEILSVLQGLLR